MDTTPQVHQQLRRQKQLFESLVAVARATSGAASHGAPSLQTTLHNVLEVAAGLTGAENGDLFLLDAANRVTDSIVLHAVGGPELQRDSIRQVMENGLAGWVARHRQSALIGDTARDERWINLVHTPYVARSALSVPIVSGPALVGILTLVHSQPGHFKLDHSRLIQAAADQIALAIRNAQIFDAQRRMAERQTTLYEVLRTVSGQLDPGTVACLAVESIARYTGWPNVCIILPDEKGDRWTIRAISGPLSPAGLSCPIGAGIVGRALRTGQTQIVPDVTADPDYVSGHPAIRSEAALPLRRGSRLLGVLNIESDRTDAFEAEDVPLAESLAEAVALALDNAQLYEAAQRELGERRRVEHALRASEQSYRELFAGAQRQAQEMELLDRVRTALARERDLPVVFHTVVESTSRTFGYPLVGIYLIQRDPATGSDMLCLQDQIGYERVLPRIGLNEGITGRVARTGQPMLVQDTRLAPEFLEAVPGIVSEVCVPLMDEGRVVGVLNIESDIKLSEADLRLMTALGEHVSLAISAARLYSEARDNAERLWLLAEGSEDMIAIQDLEGRCTFFNGLRRHRLDASNILGKAPHELLDPEVAAQVVQQHAQVIATNGPVTFELHVLMQGKMRWLTSYMYPIRDAAGRINSVGTIAHDITGRKEAEQALAQHARELAALYETSLEINSQPDVPALLEAIVARSAQLLDLKMGGVYLLQDDGHTLELAVSFRLPGEYVGITLQPGEGVAGRVAQSGQPLTVEDYHTWEGHAAAYVDPLFHGVLGVPLKLGQRVIGVLTIDDDKPTQFSQDQVRLASLFADQAAIAIENARLRQAERDQVRRLRESQARLIQAEKMGALGRLVASIAHEVNNPLQAMQSASDLLAEEIEADGSRVSDKFKRHLDIVRKETDRIAAIVRRVRDFYRPARPETHLTDIHAILSNVLELAGKQLQNHAIAVECDWAAELPAAVANPDHLMQVFLNLVLNAVDAMSGAGQAGGTLRVRTGRDQIRTRDNRVLPAVRVEFEDSGPGMPPEVLAQLFEPFFTTKPGGTGLGLAISYEIVQAHDGQITATSREGAGTVFAVSLPVGQ